MKPISYNYFFLFLIFGMLLFWSACDVGHTKDYYITNNYADSIVVKYDIIAQTDSQTIFRDSTALIHTHWYVYGTVGVKDDRESDEVSNVVIEVNNKQIEVEESVWKYEELEKYHAEYTLLVDSSLVN